MSADEKRAPETPSTSPSPLRWLRLLGLIAGPSLALLGYFWFPTDYESAAGEALQLDTAGRATLAMMIWMSVWWLTEATDLTITALLPVAVFPVVGISTIEAATKPYADKIVFLFLGGFLLALSMQHWGLGKRIALYVLKQVGTRPSWIIGGFMIITAVFSAFVSNVATVAMMLPIALSVISMLERSGEPVSEDGDSRSTPFSTCLLISIAYSSSIGGISTIIGTAPNAILISQLKKLESGFAMDVTFVDWMKFGVPFAVLLLGGTWLLMTQVLFRIPKEISSDSQAVIAKRGADLGPVKRGELVTLIMFVITVIAWMFHSTIPNTGLSDAGIVMITSLALFLIPAGRDHMGSPQFVMSWDIAKHVPWNILILFGGGLSLASAVQANGVTEYLGSQLAFLQGSPPWLIVLAVTTVVVFMTELTSNTATTASLLPVLVALATVIGIHPAILAIAAGVSASCAFMLPVATPPNAIVYGSGHISIRQMAQCGFWLNLIAIMLVTLMAMHLAPLVFGIKSVAH
ncbi:MAG: SLC13 family permease [Pirellulaceae bacterium]